MKGESGWTRSTKLVLWMSTGFKGCIESLPIKKINFKIALDWKIWLLFSAIKIGIYYLKKNNQEIFDKTETRGQCYKNTTVNYRSNFNPTFSRVKMTLKNDLGLKNITAILG